MLIIVIMNKQKVKAKRRIIQAKIDFLSLCPKGANTIQTVYKTDDGQNKSVSFSTLTKDMTEQGELITCVYSPDLVDSQGDVASIEAIKEMAYSFSRDGKGIDIRHNGKVIPKEEVFVAESFIIQKSDPRFEDIKDYDGEVVDVTGGWGAVIKIENEELRKLYKSGEWGGISMGGLMVVQDAEKDDKTALQKALDSIVNYFTNKENNNNNTDSEINMDAKELKTILDANNTALVTAIKEALKPAEETAEQKTARLAKEAEAAKSKKKMGLGYPQPVLKEQPTTTDIEQYERKLEIFELSKAVDPENLESIRQFQVLSKEIATGKKVETKKADSDAYGSFFTNQDGSLVKKESDDPIADGVLALCKKEQEAKTKAA